MNIIKENNEKSKRLNLCNSEGCPLLQENLGVNTENLNKISILSRGQVLGFNSLEEEDLVDRFGYTTKTKMFEQLMIAYGGIAAEIVMLNDITSGSADDLYKANYMAQAMIRRFGMMGITNSIESRITRSAGGCSQRKKREVEKITDKLLKKAFKKAVKFIMANKMLFYRLYNKLLECNVLYKEEIEEIINEISNRRLCYHR